MSRSHPPLFDALASRLSPRHPVSVLARRIAFSEDRAPVLETRIVYRPHGWSDHHEKDYS